MITLLETDRRAIVEALGDLRAVYAVRVHYPNPEEKALATLQIQRLNKLIERLESHG